ncbi:hypothetical protein GN244_ATG02431 [Phytophthora infestans]|uniref:Uncharacterized protein n=1 Tax=Phytophthora infestans TaxID=4787 RepID=A0A833W713_PHYIN|nr:hypothetical protein GN244_ATG02431 [Phytophthora infestans]
MVTKIDRSSDNPAHVDTGEVLWKVMMVSRVQTASGRKIPSEGRNLRTVNRFDLHISKEHMAYPMLKASAKSKLEESRHRRSYTFKFKQEVLLDLEFMSTYTAKEVHGVPRRTIRNWEKEREA